MINAKDIRDLNAHPDARLIAAAPDLLEACKEGRRFGAYISGR